MSPAKGAIACRGQFANEVRPAFDLVPGRVRLERDEQPIRHGRVVVLFGVFR
jgi:hypothetical protein